MTITNYRLRSMPYAQCHVEFYTDGIFIKEVRLYSSYGRACAAACKYAQHYECNYLLKQLTFNYMRKFEV